MKRLAFFFILLVPTLFAARLSHGQPAAIAAAESAASVPQQPPAESEQKKITEYTLPPDLYRKARNLGQIDFWENIAFPIYGWAILWLVLRWRLAPKYRTWAEKTGSARFLQAAVFTPPFVLALAVLNLPLDLLSHWISRKFGISVQSWTSWSWDWTKSEMIIMIFGSLTIWILYAIIRKSPRCWWFYFWLISLPILVFLVFLQPLIVDPLFHKFEPLAQKDAALAENLEKMVHRAGEDIPPQRMYWMNASEKLNAIDAYVTGVGASKRIVIWDTTIAKMTTPQIVYVAGHEMGHYVLNHIWKGLALGAIGLFILFYLGYRTIGALLARFGQNWQIRSVDDWASLPALLLLISIFAFIGSPVGNAFSRHIEHQADQYGLEVTHGLTPDSNQTAAQSFQILGEVDLGDPAPNAVAVLLFYSHPPIGDRVRFASTYEPWAHGQRPEFVK